MSEVESINPNTPVTSNLTKEGSIEANATSGPLSFDELEEVTKAEKKAKSESKQEKSKDLTSDTDKGKSKEPKKQPEKVERSEETKAAEDIEKQIKKIKAKYNDAEYELEEDALVPVKINGKEEMVAIKDILGNYSGKVAWDKKFSEVDQIRKTNTAKELKLKEIENMIKGVYEEQDPNMKMFKMSQLAGLDPVEFRNKFFNENISLLEKWYTMTEDERKADALAYEASVHKHRADTLEKGIKEKQDFESLQTSVDQLRERHGITEREFVESYDHLEQLARNGQINPKDLTAEKVIKTVQESRIFNKAYETIQKLDLGWDQKEIVNKLSRFTDEAMNIGLDLKDVPEMVDQLWGISKARNKIEEKKKQNEEFLSGKKSVSQMKSPSSGPVFFDEM